MATLDQDDLNAIVGALQAAVLPVNVTQWTGAEPRALNGDLVVVQTEDLDSSALDDIAAITWNYSGPRALTTAGTSYVEIREGYYNGTIEIRKGDSYGTSSGKRITISKPTGASWPSDLASAPWTVKFQARKISTDDGSAASTLGPITCTLNSATSVDVPLTAAQTAALVLNTEHAGNQWQWDLQAANGLLRNTLVSGTMTVLPEVTTG